MLLSLQTGNVESLELCFQGTDFIIPTWISVTWPANYYHHYYYFYLCQQLASQLFTTIIIIITFISSCF